MTTAIKYKPYSKYKPSGIDWLGKVPSEWETKRLRYYFNYHAGGVWGDEENGSGNNMICFRVADFDFGHLGLSENDLTVRNIPENQHSRILEKGDILLEKSGGGEKQPVGRAVRFEQDVRAVCSNFIEKLTPLGAHNSKFISYLMGALYFETLNMKSIKQTTGIQNLDLYSYLCEIVPFPSKETQKVIADFLDRETAKIDDVVVKKQKLIELLKEKRQALITRAVTKGLDPKVKMKPSGIDWLGNIPERWDILAIWMLFYMGRGRVINNEEILNNPGDYPVYSSQTENDGILGYIATYDFDGDYITWTTDGANAGTVFNRKGKFNCTNVCGTLRTKNLRQVDLRFFTHVLNVCTKVFVRYDINPKLMNNVMAGIRVQVPPIKGQKEICDFIDRETGRVGELIKKVEKQLEKLQEYRQALISNAVTGKIKV